jgi:hypothetical protein
MGGNAIKNTRRIKRDEFVQLCFELQEHFPELKMKPVKAYKQKPDFGDIDMVVEIDPNYNIHKLVKERLNPSLELHNNMFYSFEYKGVQVDFISMSKENFLTALNYFAWNDLGNFIGRTARSLNFKYGHEGLMYELRLGDHYKNTILVSKNSKKILEFLGYDYEKWNTGFETKDEIFEFAVNSKYFNVSYFTLEDQSHNDRVRNKKRKMYQDMLAYIAEHNLINSGSGSLFSEKRLEHYNRARVCFGESFHEEVIQSTKEFEKQLKFKEYFNGDIVSKTTGLHGKELGKLMQIIKTMMVVVEGNESYIDYILNHPIPDILITDLIASALNTYDEDK